MESENETRELSSLNLPKAEPEGGYRKQVREKNHLQG